MKIDTCPKCGMPGFITKRWAKNPKYTAYYVAHYSKERYILTGKKSGRTWCYLLNKNSDGQISFDKTRDRLKQKSCYACGSDKTYTDHCRDQVTPHHHWYGNPPTDLWLCQNCNNKYITNPKHHPITNKRRKYVRGKGTVYLSTSLPLRI